MKIYVLSLVCSLYVRSGNSQDATQNVTGLDVLVTDWTRHLTLTCHANTSSRDQIVWFTPGTENKRCETGTPDNMCTFTPRLEDDNHYVTCLVINDQGTSTRALYRVNLNYPPPSSPTISTASPQTEPLKQGDIITCSVSGGKPRVTNVTFHCHHPDHTDREDDVSDDERTMSSSVTVHISNTTGVYMNCTCSATWQPEPDLYSDKTAMSFLLETSPRILNGSYDLLNPPILETTGRTFFLVAYPMPHITESYFLETNKPKEPVPENTFKTQFTRNSTMTHLVYCRVTPQNVPDKKLGLYELSMSNRLGEVSLLFNVTSPVIQHSEKKAIGPGVIVGVIGGIVLLVGIIVTIVIFVIRRERCAGYKGHDDSKPAISIMPPTATLHDVQPDANDKINACPSSTFIESEPGYATPGEVRKTDCRSTDSKSGTIINSEQDDYNHLNENNAPPVDSATYSRVDADSRGAQPDVSTDSAKPNSLAPNDNTSTGKITLPNGDEYSTVAHQQKGGNPPPTDEE